jgi:autotransporter-associated beta strand protein
MKPTHSLRAFLLGSTLLATATSLHAVDYWWDSNSTTAGFGTTNGTWGTSTFISTSSAGTGATANTATTTSDLLNIGTSTDGYTGGRTITVNGTRQIGSITVGSASGTVLMSGGTAINLGGTATITNNSASVLTIATPITGSAGLFKAGTGALFLEGASTFTGNISITSGTFQINGGTARIGTGGDFAGTVSISSGANLTYNSGLSQNLNGIISGAGQLRLAGASTLRLNQANTFTGDTSIVGGFTLARLQLDNNLALQNSALNTGTAVSGRLIFGTGVTTPTFGGLKGSVDLASAAITNYNLVTALTLNPGVGFSPSYSGAIANGAAGMTLTKSGLGTQTLSGANSYTGATNVTAGILAVDGSLGNTSTTIGTGSPNTGTLQGIGTIGGSVSIANGGTLAPGNSIESLGTGALSFAGGSTYAYELQTNLFAGTPNDAGDLTYTTSTLDIASGALLTLTDLATSTALAYGSKLSLISYSGGWDPGEEFTYLGSPLLDDSTFTLGANEWRFNYNDTLEGLNFASDSPNGQSYVTMTVVPEPGAALLGSLGILALLRRRR